MSRDVSVADPPEKQGGYVLRWQTGWVDERLLEEWELLTGAVALRNGV